MIDPQPDQTTLVVDRSTAAGTGELRVCSDPTAPRAARAREAEKTTVAMTDPSAGQLIETLHGAARGLS